MAAVEPRRQLGENAVTTWRRPRGQRSCVHRIYRRVRRSSSYGELAGGEAGAGPRGYEEIIAAYFRQRSGVRLRTGADRLAAWNFRRHRRCISQATALS